ncbi:MAG: hypothetical protein Q8K43_11610 [Sulfurimicrobium sp.]|jgi:hypothetical protein|nr:hypothetical protein [Sulfurimicrobium sp.]MDO9189461.1 hypothetical protein [Sulfurimicrobium sp.]MDP1704169.1 hypothetical protein [Sulfurimicrobium sp.]MDP1898519.1 hypothetical protein [Sulfurimicrobium sp.]MDP2197725.1 hypothetical protein [Sulfurimicrobium sp.]
MPYFVYKVTTFPFKQFEPAGQFEAFKEASAHAKSLRQALAADAKTSIKVMFGENQLQAEDLLNQEREPQPMTGEDY